MSNILEKRDQKITTLKKKRNRLHSKEVLSFLQKIHKIISKKCSAKHILSVIQSAFNLSGHAKTQGRLEKEKVEKEIDQVLALAEQAAKKQQSLRSTTPQITSSKKPHDQPKTKSTSSKKVPKKSSRKPTKPSRLSTKKPKAPTKNTPPRRRSIK